MRQAAASKWDKNITSSSIQRLRQVRHRVAKKKWKGIRITYSCGNCLKHSHRPVWNWAGFETEVKESNVETQTKGEKYFYIWDFATQGRWRETRSVKQCSRQIGMTILFVTSRSRQHVFCNWRNGKVRFLDTLDFCMREIGRLKIGHC